MLGDNGPFNAPFSDLLEHAFNPSLREPEPGGSL